jgi:hypothetical protein
MARPGSRVEPSSNTDERTSNPVGPSIIDGRRTSNRSGRSWSPPDRSPMAAVAIRSVFSKSRPAECGACCVSGSNCAPRRRSRNSAECASKRVGRAGNRLRRAGNRPERPDNRLERTSDLVGRPSNQVDRLRNDGGRASHCPRRSSNPAGRARSAAGRTCSEIAPRGLSLACPVSSSRVPPRSGVCHESAAALPACVGQRSVRGMSSFGRCMR